MPYSTFKEVLAPAVTRISPLAEISTPPLMTRLASTTTPIGPKAGIGTLKLGDRQSSV
jgi:hypothetical protein